MKNIFIKFGFMMGLFALPLVSGYGDGEISIGKKCQDASHIERLTCQKEHTPFECAEALQPEVVKCNEGQPHNFAIWRKAITSSLGKKCQDASRIERLACQKEHTPFECAEALQPEVVKCNEGQPYNFAIWRKAITSSLGKKCQDASRIERLACQKEHTPLACAEALQPEIKKCEAGSPHNFGSWRETLIQ
jgi:transcriptional regulator NrdR family protein